MNSREKSPIFKWELKGEDFSQIPQPQEFFRFLMALKIRRILMNPEGRKGFWGKRGQFYLIAAIIIAIILIGLNYTYTAAKGNVNKLDVYELAQEIRYEVKQLVENLVLKGKTGNEIADNIKANVTDYYLNRFVNADIAVVYGNETKAYIINKTGVSEVTPVGGKFNAALLGAQHEVDISKQNIYVLVGAEKEGEKSIAIE